MSHGGYDFRRRGFHANSTLSRPAEYSEGTRLPRGDRAESLVLVELGGGTALHPAEPRPLGGGIPEPGPDARDAAPGGPRGSGAGRELRRQRGAGPPVLPGVPEEVVVVRRGPLRRRRRPGGLFFVRVRDRRRAPDLFRGTGSPLGGPPEVRVRPWGPVGRCRITVPERILPSDAVPRRMAAGAVPRQRLVQHAGDDGDGDGWPPPRDRRKRRRRDGEGAGVASGCRPYPAVPARQQRQGELPPRAGDHVHPVWRRPGHADPAGDPARRGRGAGAEGPRHPSDRLPYERRTLRVPGRGTDPRPDGVAAAHVPAGAGDGARHRRLHHPHPRPRGERTVRSGPVAEIPRTEGPAAGDPVGRVPRPRAVGNSPVEGVRDDGVRPPVGGLFERRGEAPRRDLPGDVEGTVAGAPRGGGADPRDHQRDPHPFLAQPRDVGAVHEVLRPAVLREARGPRGVGPGRGDPPGRTLADPPVAQGAAFLLSPQAAGKTIAAPRGRGGAPGGGGGDAEPRGADHRLLPAVRHLQAGQPALPPARPAGPAPVGPRPSPPHPPRGEGAT